MDNIFYDLMRDGATPESLAEAMNAALRRYEEDQKRAAVETEKAKAAEATAEAAKHASTGNMSTVEGHQSAMDALMSGLYR